MKITKKLEVKILKMKNDFFYKMSISKRVDKIQTLGRDEIFKTEEYFLKCRNKNNKEEWLKEINRVDRARENILESYIDAAKGRSFEKFFKNEAILYKDYLCFIDWHRKLHVLHQQGRLSSTAACRGFSFMTII